MLPCANASVARGLAVHRRCWFLHLLLTHLVHRVRLAHPPPHRLSARPRRPDPRIPSSPHVAPTSAPKRDTSTTLRLDVRILTDARAAHIARHTTIPICIMLYLARFASYLPHPPFLVCTPQLIPNVGGDLRLYAEAGPRDSDTMPSLLVIPMRMTRRRWWYTQRDAGSGVGTARVG
ncbi:hypothetical protein B0H16DRAFT_1544661 [Mycena metata]|uniref:Uncharacterized protein n=1 Tax=Mycena metata TaxID=1033252 RepID=A0AAD7NAZ3_9AGAR|nr:hypothetical protein B0H16DRAFT_1544661 [Mycena metata]